MIWHGRRSWLGAEPCPEGAQRLSIRSWDFMCGQREATAEAVRRELMMSDLHFRKASWTVWRKVLGTEGPVSCHRSPARSCGPISGQLWPRIVIYCSKCGIWTNSFDITWESVEMQTPGISLDIIKSDSCGPKSLRSAIVEGVVEIIRNTEGRRVTLKSCLFYFKTRMHIVNFYWNLHNRSKELWAFTASVMIWYDLIAEGLSLLL